MTTLRRHRGEAGVEVPIGIKSFATTRMNLRTWSERIPPLTKKSLQVGTVMPIKHVAVSTVREYKGSMHTSDNSSCHLSRKSYFGFKT